MRILHKIKSFFDNLKRAFSWGFFMFSNYDFDYIYMFLVLEKKLKEMEKAVREGVCLTRYSHSRMIKIALYYLEKIIEDDYCKKEFDLFREKYGRISCHREDTGDGFIRLGKTTFTKCKTIEECKKADKVFKRIFSLENYRKEKTIKRFFHIMERWHGYWWD